MATDTPMQLGMVGLGRMGAGIVRRLLKDGHECVGYDVSAEAVKALTADGATGSTSLEEFAAALEKPRAAWVMVPAGEITSKTISALAETARKASEPTACVASGLCAATVHVVPTLGIPDAVVRLPAGFKHPYVATSGVCTTVIDPVCPSDTCTMHM